MYQSHTELLFTVKPFYNLSLPLSIKPDSLVLCSFLVEHHWVVLCAWWNPIIIGGSRIFLGGAQGRVHPDVY